jgi:hypothetical protein
MNQITAFPKMIAVEFRKSRHKHSFLLPGAVVVLNYFFLFYGISPDRQEWYNVLYGIPVINTLVLSVLMAVIASQSVDMEHKGAMWNLLPCFTSSAFFCWACIFLRKRSRGNCWQAQMGTGCPIRFTAGCLLN